VPKLIALIKAKPGLSREQFIDYYESNHAPLVRRLLPMIGAYRRNYVTDTDWHSERPRFDYADEANFLQSEATRMFEVEEHPRDRSSDE
jgi:hypothetical protein